MSRTLFPLTKLAIFDELLTHIPIDLWSVILRNVLRCHVTGASHRWVYVTGWRGYHGWKRKEAGQRGMWRPVNHCVTTRMKFWSLGNHHNPSNTVILNNLYSERHHAPKEKWQFEKYVSIDPYTKSGIVNPLNLTKEKQEIARKKKGY